MRKIDQPTVNNWTYYGMVQYALHCYGFFIVTPMRRKQNLNSTRQPNLDAQMTFDKMYLLLLDYRIVKMLCTHKWLNHIDLDEFLSKDRIHYEIQTKTEKSRKKPQSYKRFYGFKTKFDFYRQNKFFIFFSHHFVFSSMLDAWYMVQAARWDHFYAFYIPFVLLFVRSTEKGKGKAESIQCCMSFIYDQVYHESRRREIEKTH